MTPGQRVLLTSGEYGPGLQKGQDQSICLTFKVSPEKQANQPEPPRLPTRGQSPAVPRRAECSQRWERSSASREVWVTGGHEPDAGEGPCFLCMDGFQHPTWPRAAGGAEGAQ